MRDVLGKMRAENCLHWAVWTSCILFAALQFKNATQHQHLISPDDFVEGWSMLKPLLKDNVDQEWAVLTSTFCRYWPLLALQIACAPLLPPAALPSFYVVGSLCSLCVVVGVWVTAAFVLYPTAAFLLHWLGRKSLCYLWSVGALLLLHSGPFARFKDSLSLGEPELFLADVGLGWLIARSLSFSIDRIEAGASKRVSLLEVERVFAYSFYLPVFFSGPILTYDKFCTQLVSVRPSLSLRGVLRLFYLLSWACMYEALLHYVRFLQHHPSIVQQMDAWSLCGYGYTLPAMFHLKYFVIYGVAGGLGSLQGFNFPPPPKCISAVHLSSQLWRHFDRGLYFWILRYIYRPIVGEQWTLQRKALALSACFAFVNLWHGADKAATAWTAMNCSLVLSENVARAALNTKLGRYFKVLPEGRRVRLLAALAVPHFLLMCLSCTFFLSGWDVGCIMWRRVLLGGVYPLVPLALVMYCGCRVSMDANAG